MKNIFLLLIFTALTILVSAQENNRRGNFTGGTIKGHIIEEGTNKPVEYANIVVLSQQDSSLITGTVTGAEGNFLLNKIPPGKYILEARFIGFQDIAMEVEINRENMNLDLGDIFLATSSVNLDEVVVEGERSPVSYQIDKKVIDVSKMQTVISGNAADVLENVPSVTVDIEGNVSLRGSGNFTVLIDGRPTVLDAQDALQQIAASSIQNIEILTNPSAKFDPEGTAGIINIIMKKTEKSGFSGILDANAGLNDKFGGDFIFQYKTPGVNYNFGVDYNRRFFPGESNSERNYTSPGNSTFISSSGDMEWGRVSFSLRGGVEFLLDDLNSLSFSGRYGNRDGQRNSVLFYNEVFNSNSQRLYRSDSERERGGDFYSIGSNYLHNFNQDGHQITADIQFQYRDSDENTLSADFENGVQVDGRRTTEFGPSREVEGKIDYTLPFGENNKFEAGYQGETDISEEGNELFEFDPGSGEYEFQPDFSNTTEYSENEHAFYLLYSDQFGPLGLQGGFRTEYTNRLIEVVNLNQEFKIDRWDYFPTFHSSYKFSEATQVMASYTKRIERPRSWYLEPFLTWMDANNVRRGNPALEPEFIDSYETGFQTYIGSVTFSLEGYYRYTMNKIERIRSVYDNEVTLTSFENVGEDRSLGTEFMFILDPFEFWNLNLMGNLYDYKVEGILFNEPFERTSFNWNARMNNVIKFSKSTQLQLNFRYNSPSVSSQGRWEGFFSSDIAVRQDLFNRFLTVTLQVRDILGTAKHEFTSEGPGFYEYNYFERESPMVMLNMRLNFNNFKQNRDGRGIDNGMGEDEF